MKTAILLCFAILSAENSARVQAKVLYGTDADQQHRADIDLWINQAVTKMGPALAQPLTGWISLTDNEQRIYTSAQGGCILDGKASRRNGKYDVEINGCDGGPLQLTATMKPGERRVVMLTDSSPQHNIFVALEAPLSELTKKRVAQMKANATSFRLELNYDGEADKPFYRLILSVPETADDDSNSFHRIVRINEDQACKLIDHLARDGFLKQAVDQRTNTKILRPTMPGYTMKVATGDVLLYEDLGWGLTMIERLDALRAALPDEAKKDMDFLLARLSGLRAKWLAEQPALTVKAGREGSRVRVSVVDGQTIVEIVSDFGIDKATMTRRFERWPKSILIRLHLRGLESFTVDGKESTVGWSVSSGGDHATRMTLWQGGKERAVPADSPYRTELRIVGGEAKIPLKDGYFEVPLPAKLLEENPDQMILRWIDFYRN